MPSIKSFSSSFVEIIPIIPTKSTHFFSKNTKNTQEGNSISRGYSLRTFVSDFSRIIYSCIIRKVISQFIAPNLKKKELGAYHNTLNSIVTRLIVRVKNPKVNCIAKRILSIIQNIDVSIRSLINESEREFNVDISYKTMWRAKEKVLLKVNNHSHDLILHDSIKKIN